MKSLVLVSIVVTSALLTSRAAHADSEGAPAAVLVIGMGATDVTLATFDTVYFARGESAGSRYAAVETLLAAPQVALGIYYLASRWNIQADIGGLPTQPPRTETYPNSWSHRVTNMALLAVPTALMVHGIVSWSTYEEKPVVARRGVTITPTLVGDAEHPSAGLMAFGRF